MQKESGAALRSALGVIGGKGLLGEVLEGVEDEVLDELLGPFGVVAGDAGGVGTQEAAGEVEVGEDDSAVADLDHVD